MRLRSFWHFSRLTHLLLDYLLLWAAVVCAFKLSPRYTGDILIGPWLNEDLRFVGYGMPLFMALGLQVTGLRRSEAKFRFTAVLTQIVFGLLGGMLAFGLLHAAVQFSLIGRFVLIFSLIYGTAFMLGSRLLVGKLAEQHRRKVFVYGSQSTITAIAQQLPSALFPIQLVGHAHLESLLPEEREEFSQVVKHGLYAHCEQVGAEEIVVEFPDALPSAEREALLRCSGLGVRVVELGYFIERDFERVHVAGLKESWFWGYNPAQAHPVYFAAKRALDILISLAGIVTFAPLAPFVIALIKLQDGGPVFYSQIRVGLQNQPFRIYKFRTMQLDAESTGARWAQPNDGRATRFGHFLRLTRIDEVPQFWNILRGEMSFIGPRPERPELVEAIEQEVPYYRYRHLIQPGLTGWAQVNYPYGASIEDARQKLSYDLYYMKYSSGALEFLIILRTIVAMVRGAR